MRKNRLYEDFFKENPMDETSAPFISDFTLAALFNDTMVAEMERSIAGKISDERKARISADKAAVEQLTSGEEIVSYMRKNHDVIADSAFCKKALTMEDEAVPLIIKRYKTTFQDRFVEVAFLFFQRQTENMRSSFSVNTKIFATPMRSRWPACCSASSRWRKPDRF